VASPIETITIFCRDVNDENSECGGITAMPGETCSDFSQNLVECDPNAPPPSAPPPITPSPTPAPISAAPPPSGGECFEDEDCPIDESCIDGSCVSDFGFE
jgi:hypothetical protein